MLDNTPALEISNCPFASAALPVTPACPPSAGRVRMKFGADTKTKDLPISARWPQIQPILFFIRRSPDIAMEYPTLISGSTGYMIGSLVSHAYSGLRPVGITKRNLCPFSPRRYSRMTFLVLAYHMKSPQRNKSSASISLIETSPISPKARISPQIISVFWDSTSLNIKTREFKEFFLEICIFRREAA